MTDDKKQQTSEQEQQTKGFALFWSILKTYYLNLVLLNLLFIVSCIPVVTIGPALYALNTVTVNLARQKPMQPIAEYREAFKTNFLKHMWIGLGILALAAALVFSLNFYFNIASLTVLYYVAIILVFSAVIIIASGAMYLFKLLVIFEQPLKLQIKNAVLLSISSPGALLKVFLFVLVPAYLLIRIPVFGLLLTALILIALASVSTSIITWSVIKKHI